MQEALPESSPLKPNENEEEWDDTWEDLSSELENEESCDNKEESADESQDDNDVRKQPSFEVLHDCPLFINSDFLKIKENIFTEQQTTFAFGNMNSNHCSLLEMNQKIQNAKWLPSPKELIGKDGLYTPKVTEKRNFKRKNRKFDGLDFVVPSAGFAIGMFATNAFAFVLGFSLGWLSRDSIPTLAVYEFYLDPNVM